MSPAHTALLYDRYPALFAQRHLPIKSSMWMGFSCRDGWFDLIEELCSKLQAGVERGDFPQIEAVQVKEKYAELRFYFGPRHDAADAIVQDARALTICEICGAPGVLYELRDWYRTRCKLHAEPGSAVVPDDHEGRDL